jgi:hypothetical protein
MSVQSNRGEFATFKSLEIEGIGTTHGINPVEFDGIGCQGDARA